MNVPYTASEFYPSVELYYVISNQHLGTEAILILVHDSGKSIISTQPPITEFLNQNLNQNLESDLVINVLDKNPQNYILFHDETSEIV